MLAQGFSSSEQPGLVHRGQHTPLSSSDSSSAASTTCACSLSSLGLSHRLLLSVKPLPAPFFGAYRQRVEVEVGALRLAWLLPVL